MKYLPFKSSSEIEYTHILKIFPVQIIRKLKASIKHLKFAFPYQNQTLVWWQQIRYGEGILLYDVFHNRTSTWLYDSLSQASFLQGHRKMEEMYNHLCSMIWMPKINFECVVLKNIWVKDWERSWKYLVYLTLYYNFVLWSMIINPFQKNDRVLFDRIYDTTYCWYSEWNRIYCNAHHCWTFDVRFTCFVNILLYFFLRHVLFQPVINLLHKKLTQHTLSIIPNLKHVTAYCVSFLKHDISTSILRWVLYTSGMPRRCSNSSCRYREGKRR